MIGALHRGAFLPRHLCGAGGEIREFLVDHVQNRYHGLCAPSSLERSRGIVGLVHDVGGAHAKPLPGQEAIQRRQRSAEFLRRHRNAPADHPGTLRGAKIGIDVYKGQHLDIGVRQAGEPRRGLDEIARDAPVRLQGKNERIKSDAHQIQPLSRAQARTRARSGPGNAAAAMRRSR